MSCDCSLIWSCLPQHVWMNIARVYSVVSCLLSPYWRGARCVVLYGIFVYALLCFYVVWCFAVHKFDCRIFKSLLLILVEIGCVHYFSFAVLTTSSYWTRFPFFWQSGIKWPHYLILLNPFPLLLAVWHKMAYLWTPFKQTKTFSRQEIAIETVIIVKYFWFYSGFSK